MSMPETKSTKNNMGIINKLIVFGRHWKELSVKF